jgi:Fe-S-cluster containining protein
LFADVELQARDNADRLSALGLQLERKGRKLAFAQPCACFDGKLCRIYGERPARCRNFNCGTLQRVAKGELGPAAALTRIKQVRREVESVSRQLRDLGNADEELPLMRRFAVVMAEPLDLAGDPEVIARRARLMADLDTLMGKLHREFLA